MQISLLTFGVNDLKMNKYPRKFKRSLLLFHVFLQETFYRVQLWLQELEKHYIPGSTVMWLIGNKADLGHARQVSEQVQERGSSFKPNL